MTTLYYVTAEDLADRIGAQAMVDMLDYDRDGVPDPPKVLRLLLDAVSYVESYLRGTYDLTVLRAMETPPNEVARLVLDRAEAELYCRHPEFARFDGYKAKDRCDHELRKLVEGARRLDVVGPPEPAANEGGTTGSFDPRTPAGRTPRMFDDLGDFA
jgi:phage gp36-like protein